MTSDELQAKLIELSEAVALHSFAPATILDVSNDRGEWTLFIEPHSIRNACEFLKTQWGYRTLSNATAVDWYPSEPRFQVVYHLLSHERKTRLRLKCQVSGANPEIDSVTPVWSSADWDEREIFDLFGIRFQGHPDLRRILLPDGWEGHPLRKDYPVTGYR
jgi:NADH-quinone oxidoreductase subunit C